MSDYVPVEYPKWVGGVIVNSHEEELAHLEEATKPEPVPLAAAREPNADERAEKIIQSGSMSSKTGE